MISDDTRRPLPGYDPAPGRPRYLITPLGNVYRDDGWLMKPRVDPKQPHRISIGFAGGDYTRSLALSVANAYSRVKAQGNDWSTWVDPDGPVNLWKPAPHSQGPWRLVSRRGPGVVEILEISVYTIKLVYHGDLIRWRNGKGPKPPRSRCFSILGSAYDTEPEPEPDEEPEPS